MLYGLTGSYSYTCVLSVIVGGEDESHGKSLDTFNLTVMCLPIRDGVAHLFIILFDADFVALCLIFFFSPEACLKIATVVLGMVFFLC